MADRKVLNKYYPPDFDPTKLPRGQRPKNDQELVRMMMPMSVRCNTCGEYIYRGKKFNSKKETVQGEDYLGIRIFRFYMRCPVCAAEFTIKTDPKNSHYLSEMGCSMNHEPWQFREQEIQTQKKRREFEDESDPMKALENRTKDSKIEMDIMAALHEIRQVNSRNSKIDPDKVLELLKQKEDQNLQQQGQIEFEKAKEFFAKKKELTLKHQADPAVQLKNTTLQSVEDLQTNKPELPSAPAPAVAPPPKTKINIFSAPKKPQQVATPQAVPKLKKAAIAVVKKKESATPDESSIKKAKLVDYDEE